MRTLALSSLLAVGLAAAQDQPPPPPPPPAEAPPAPPAPPQQALELYRQASLCLHEKRFAEARELWDALATGFPKQPFSDEARYWRARCLEHLGQFEGARLGYRAILSEPHSGWVQDAREGLTRIESGPGTYSVVRVEGDPLRGRLHALDPEHVQVWVEGAAEPARLRWVEIKELAPVAEAGPARLVLTSGDRLSGRIARATGEWVELHTTELGTLKLPHARIRRLDVPVAVLHPSHDNDFVFVGDGDGDGEDVEVIETPDGKRVVIKKKVVRDGHDGPRVDVDVDVTEGPDGKRVVIKKLDGHGHDGHHEDVEVIETPDGKRVVIKKKVAGKQAQSVWVERAKDGEKRVIVIEGEDREGRPGVVFVPGDEGEEHVMVLRQGDGKHSRKIVLRQDGKGETKAHAVIVLDDEDHDGEQRFEFELEGVDLDDDHSWGELPIKIRKQVHEALKGKALDGKAMRALEEALEQVPHTIRKRVRRATPAKRIYEFRSKDGNMPFGFDGVDFTRRSGNAFFHAEQRGAKDRVFLENGDVLSGELESMDGEHLRLKADFGRVEIKRSKVARVVFKQHASTKAAPARPRVRTETLRVPRAGTRTLRAPRAPQAPHTPKVAPGKQRAFLGIGYENAEGGVRVTSIVPGSTAAELLQEGDVLRTFNGTRLQSGEDLRRVIQGLHAGDSIQLEGSRNGGSFQIQTRIGSQPKSDEEDSSFFGPETLETRSF